MTFQEFLPHIAEAIREYAGEEKEIQIHTVIKNNDEKRTALMIRDPDGPKGTPSPVIYLEDYYGKAQEGVPVRHLARMICDVALVTPPDFALERLSSYDKAKDHVFCQMVNKEKNKTLLEERPYEDWQDLAIVYYCELGEDGSFGATTKVTYALMDSLGVSEETVKADAWKNTLKTEAVLRPLSGVLEEMGGPGYGESPLYLLSNGKMANGAIAAAYPDTCRKAEEIFGGNFFLIPSSIHEFLLLPDTGDVDARTLDEMIEAINMTNVEPGEVLSDHAYYYDGRTKDISIASEYQEKQKLERQKEGKTISSAGKTIPFPVM